MNNQLTVIESQLNAIAPKMEGVLARSGLPVDRIIRTVMVSLENNGKLAQANASTILQSAMSAAVLGLEVDGVTGQGYLVPFQGKAQFLAGYKGFVTIAARSSRTLQGFVVREGDGFEFDEVSGEVRHKRRLGNEDERKLIAAYAVSRGVGMPQLLKVMSLDELIAIRDQSAGWKARGQRSTWGTNFDAMCRKTPMRALSNDIPSLPLQMSNALDVHHDLGQRAYIREDDTIVIDAEKIPEAGPGPDLDIPEYKIETAAGDRQFKDVNTWLAFMNHVLQNYESDKVEAMYQRNRERIAEVVARHPEHRGAMINALGLHGIDAEI